MAHIIKWEQIVLMGHVGHMVHMGHVGHVGHLLQMLCVGHILHMSPIRKWFTHEWTFQMNINMCSQVGPKLKQGALQKFRILLNHVHMNRHSFAYKSRCIPH
jgi:hypothetical protein